MKNQMTLAKNLSEEPWGYSFFKYCLERSHNHCHIETFGKYIYVYMKFTKPSRKKYMCCPF